MRRWLPFTLGLTILGCNGASSTPEPASPASPPSSDATTASTSPPSATPPTTSPSATSNSASSTGGSGLSKTQSNTDPRTGEDPNRINQLKDLKVAILTANGHKIKAWVMDTESKRQEGMMFLQDKDVRKDEGMLFVFSAVQSNDGNGFWMHNCPLGLDICYIAPNKKVINIADGKPYDDTPLPAKAPYRWVLEMKTNCAKQIGIKAGVQLQIPSGLVGTQ